MKAKIELTPKSGPNNLEKDPVEAAFDRDDWLTPNKFGNYLKDELMRLNEEIQHRSFVIPFRPTDMLFKRPDNFKVVSNGVICQISNLSVCRLSVAQR